MTKALASILLTLLLPLAHANAQTAPSGPGVVAFEKVKTLVGEWQAPEGQETMINIFRPIAFGTAILHEEWKSGQQLTATVFYLVGSDLHADHFCDFQNQLRFLVKPSADGGALSFELHDAINLDTHPRHFHGSIWTLRDTTHMTQDWQIVAPGKDPKTVRLDFTRTKTQADLWSPKAPVDIVRADAATLTNGDLEGFLALYSPDAKIFGVSDDPHKLVGKKSERMDGAEKLRAFFQTVFAKRPLPKVEIVDLVSMGELVVARVKLTDPPAYDRPEFVMAVYRVRDGLIHDLWHVARETADAPKPAKTPEQVLHELQAASNRVDVEAWLGLFSPEAKQWKRAQDPDQLANVPSVKAYDQASRRVAYEAAFSTPPHGRFEIAHTVTVGDLIASRGAFVFPDRALQTFTIYRVHDGLLQDIWDVEQNK